MFNFIKDLIISTIGATVDLVYDCPMVGYCAIFIIALLVIL